MTTYQKLAQETGADLALVKSVKYDILGNRHHCTSRELEEIRLTILQRMKENDHETIRKSL